MKRIIFLFFICFSALNGFTQTNGSYRVHSHNDYLQNIPFYKAIAAGASSVEADVFLVSDSLYVAHTKEEIDTDKSLQKLYLEPLKKSMERYALGEKKLQLLIDIKSEAYSTLDAIIKTVDKFPSITGNKNISLVISGNRPKLEDYINYPEYISFDYQSLDPVNEPSILDKIALISLSFQKFSDWNGKGRLTAVDLEKVTSTITKAHAFKKPFRFWATPDSKTSWKVFAHLGVDFINTDMPFECSDYLNTLSKREYANTVFSDVYRPTFKSDQTTKPIANIILLIGDGNGLTHISATALANKGALTLTQIKSIGLLKTQSADDFTTDSAAAGTALATGQKTSNRAIGVDTNGKNLENITELLAKKGFVNGVVTTDEITGATPSSFYAHQKDRSMSEEIMDDLGKSYLSLFIGLANHIPSQKESIGDYPLVGSIEQVGTSTVKKVGFLANNIAVDTNKNLLADATKNALQFLGGKGKPFFLMIEGAKIDSYAHENNIGALIKEGIGFDKAITEALKFADRNENTLVVITADHETAGLTIPQGNIASHEIEGDFTTHDHTATMVPVFAYGPQSFEFQGVYENNELFHKLVQVLSTPSK